MLRIQSQQPLTNLRRYEHVQLATMAAAAAATATHKALVQATLPGDEELNRVVSLDNRSHRQSLERDVTIGVKSILAHEIRVHCTQSDGQDDRHF